MVHDVLVVEDEEDIAVPLMRTLEREGYEVSRVSGGADAVEFVTGEAPSVVILDLGLPDMDGIDVCRQMRSSGYTGGIIMVTARAGELDRVVGLDVGADDAIELAGARGHHDDAAGVAAGPHLPTDVDAVHVGQPQVEDHDRGSLPGHELDS